MRIFLRLCLSLCLLLSSANSIAAPSANKPSAQNFNSTDFSRWLDAAYIAEAIYHSKSEIEDTLASQGYKIQQYNKLQGFSVVYTLATNTQTKNHIIVVRGTANAENFIVDMAFTLVPDEITGINIHQGFLLSAQGIYQQILAELKPGYTIKTIGHSLGGAAAIIVAMMLEAKGYPIAEVITFGQPKVTNISGSRKYKNLNVKRLVTPKDIVPLLPPLDPLDMMNLSIFWHQGTEILLFKNQQYAVLTGTDSMFRASDFLNDVPSERHLKDHFMTTYVNHLKTKLSATKEIKFTSDFKLSDWFGTSTK